MPYFFSGLHHSSSPAEDGKCDDPQRPNPWFTTEFWSIWYSGYSSTDSDAREYERRTWKIMANGGNGYNYYMAYGGSNFAYTNNDEDAASYDYGGASVGEGGDLRPIYYAFKRTASFARSFPDILENSTNGDDGYKNLISDTSIHITARKSHAGDIIFLENSSAQPKRSAIYQRNITGIHEDQFIAINPGEIFPIVHDFKLTSAIKLQWNFVKILGVCKQKNTTTIIIYGKPATMGKIYFSVVGKPLSVQGKESFTINKDQLIVSAKFNSTDKPVEYTFKDNDQIVRILAVNEKLSDKTWIVDENGNNYIICGTPYAGKMNVTDQKISLLTESPWLKSEDHDVWILNNNGSNKLQLARSSRNQRIEQLVLSKWQIKNAIQEAKPEYLDFEWKQSEDPLQMGADGDLTANAWYRAVINVDSPGIYSLLTDGGDRATVFIDGKKESSGNIRNGELVFKAANGKHVLAIFTAHDGRDKLAGFTGSIDSADAKGIFGETSY